VNQPRYVGALENLRITTAEMALAVVWKERLNDSGSVMLNGSLFMKG
jgi:hypothetical protein